MMLISSRLLHSVMLLASFGTRHRSVGFANADLVLHNTPQDGDLIESCPEELAAVFSCFGDESTIDTCLECAFDADTTLCAELGTLVTESYDMCVQEGKCDVACEDVLADLAQCELSATNCDEQDAKSSSDNNNLRVNLADASGGCKASGALTFNNCNRCCSNSCRSIFSWWRSLKICNAPVPAPTSAQPTSAQPTTTSPTAPAYAAPLDCVLTGQVDQSCEQCCHNCADLSTTSFSCNMDTGECGETVTNVNIVCSEPSCVRDGPVSSCDNCCKGQECFTGTTEEGTEVNSCGTEYSPKRRPSPSSMFVMPPVLTAEE